MKNQYYVYAHKKNTGGAIFYIGKGTGRRANNANGRSELWNRIVRKHGFSSLILFEDLTEKQAFEIEIESIDFFKSNGVNLCNMTNGGEGISGHKHTPEVCATISAAHKGKKQPIDLVKRRAISCTGKKRNADFCKALGERNIGRKASEETKEKMRLAHKGKKSSLTAVNKIRAWHTGKKRGDQARKNMSDSQKKTPVRCGNGLLFNSITSAAEWLKDNGFPKATKTGVWFSATGRRKLSYGFSWEYVTNPQP